MDYRNLGRSGLKVPVLSFGTGTFGGGGDFFKAWGSAEVAEATRLVDVCLEAGLTLFDSADVYSGGRAEEILGAAIKGRRDKVLISTKATFRCGPEPNEVGSARAHLIPAVEAAGIATLPRWLGCIEREAMNATVGHPLSLDELRTTVRPVCESHAVMRLDLFGSRARGTAGADSDVDLLVEFSPDSNPGLFEMGALQDALEQRLGCRVDLLSRRAVEKSKNLFRRRAILAGPVALYAR